jgi:hypothetical protein
LNYSTKFLGPFLLALISTLLVSFTTNAQSIHIGIKAGANFDHFTTSDGRSFGRPSYHLGGFLNLPLNSFLGIQPEILFNKSNARITLEGENDRRRTRFNLNYLSVPLLLNITPSEAFSLNVGPQFSVLTNRDDTAFENLGKAFSRGDLSMVFGVQFGSGPLKLYGRYNIGLTDIGSLPHQNEWKSRQIQVGLSLNIL